LPAFFTADFLGFDFATMFPPLDSPLQTSLSKSDANLKGREAGGREPDQVLLSGAPRLGSDRKPTAPDAGAIGRKRAIDLVEAACLALQTDVILALRLLAP
jgi:hypothetical protein